jgi:hypothetical protein
LPVGLNEDGSDAAGESLNLFDLGRINPQFLEIFDGGGTKQVATDPRHHEDIGSAKTRGNCLVGAFTAKAEIEFPPEDRFSGLGKLVRESCQIDVGASNHRNTRTPGHSLLQRTGEMSLFGAPARVNVQED